MESQILITLIAIVLDASMIKIYIKFLINSDGESPKQLVERLRTIGGVPLVGEYDIEVPLQETERLFPKLEAIHRSLRGSGAFYYVTTGIETPKATASIDIIEDEVRKLSDDQKMLELRKKMYKAKLARWREMGVDTATLEELLETDIERFKEVSKTYLKEHLDKNKVVEDVARDLKQVDEEVFACVDDLGVTLESICRLCNLVENDAILSLGRLISAGKVTWQTKEDKEIYMRILPKKLARPEEEEMPAQTPEQAEERVIANLKLRGSTVKQICRDSRLPEGQVMSALSDLLKKGRIKSAKRGASTVYLRAPEA
jgi:hypothetical protein